MDVNDQNLRLLKTYHPHVFQELEICRYAYPWEIEEARNGFPTLKVKFQGNWIYLHSRYDPLAEARRWAAASVDYGQENTILYGLALGYHIKEFLKVCAGIRRLTILQLGSHLLRAALSTVCLKDILSDPRIKLVITDNVKVILTTLKEELRQGASLILYRPAVSILPEAVTELREALLSFGMVQNTIRRFRPLVEENLQYFKEKQYHLRLPDISGYGRMFQGLPMILVSAGPSLQASLPQLVGLENRALIMAVGKAAVPLLKAGIYPHFIIVLDPQEIVWRQVANIENIPLIAFPTVHPRIVESY